MHREEPGAPRAYPPSKRLAILRDRHGWQVAAEGRRLFKDWDELVATVGFYIFMDTEAEAEALLTHQDAARVAYHAMKRVQRGLEP